MTQMHTWRQRLLRTPLFYKILLANLAIVALGAVAGTVITVWHVQQYPDDIHYGLIAIFASAGVVISFIVNNWVLKRALEPLDRLQRAVDDVRNGAPDVHVTLGEFSDERFDRLGDTFNQMLAQLEQAAQEQQNLSRLILQAQEEERYRLARELHDEAAQALTSLLVRLRLLERAQDPAEAQKRVQELRELTAQALEEVRRVALDLRPTILDDLGLAPALEWRVDEFNRLDGVRARFESAGMDCRLPREVELTFYRVGQEALSNVGRHAAATQVTVKLVRRDDTVRLEIADNGCGFEPIAPGDAGHHGLGLLGMRERMGMIGGSLEIIAAPAAGTRIVAQAPLAAATTQQAQEEMIQA